MALKFATRVSQIATEEMNPALKHLMRSLAASLNEAESFRKRYAVRELLALWELQVGLEQL